MVFEPPRRARTTEAYAKGSDSDEVALLGMLHEFDFRVPEDDSLYAHLRESVRQSGLGITAATADQRAAHMAAAITEAAAVMRRVDGVTSRAELRFQLVSRPTVAVAGRAAELAAMAFASANDFASGMESLRRARGLLRYAVVGERESQGFYGRPKSVAKQQRRESQRSADVERQMVRRLVALVHPHLLSEDPKRPGLAYDPPLHDAAPGVTDVASRPQSQLLVAGYLLENADDFAPVVSRLRLADAPNQVGAANPAISGERAVQVGQQVLGYLAMHAAAEVFADPLSGTEAWRRSLDLLAGSDHLRSGATPFDAAGAAVLVDPVPGLKMGIQCARAARHSLPDEGAYAALVMTVLIGRSYPTADLPPNFAVHPSLDQSFGYGPPLRQMLGQELNTFLAGLARRHAELGITMTQVSDLQRAVMALGESERLQLGVHAAIANGYLAAAEQAPEVLRGQYLLQDPATSLGVQVTEAAMYEAAFRMDCFATLAHSLGLRTGTDTVRRASVAGYREAADAYERAGSADIAQQVRGRANQLQHAFSL